MIAVNFLPKARLLAAQRRRRTRTWVFICVGYGLVLASAWAAAATRHAPTESADAELAALQSKLDSREADLAALRKSAAVVTRRLDAAKAVAEHPDWSILLGLLADLRGPEVVLERVTMTPRAGRAQTAEGPARGGATVTLGGIALTQRAASEFIMRMEAHGLFESVVLQEVRSRPGAGTGTPTLTSFSATATLADVDVPATGGKK
jgi:Tfp pilus assembly protein PilN